MRWKKQLTKDEVHDARVRHARRRIGSGLKEARRQKLDGVRVVLSEGYTESGASKLVAEDVAQRLQGQGQYTEISSRQVSGQAGRIELTVLPRRPASAPVAPSAVRLITYRL